MCCLCCSFSVCVVCVVRFLCVLCVLFVFCVCCVCCSFSCVHFLVLSVFSILCEGCQAPVRYALLCLGALLCEVLVRVSILKVALEFLRESRESLLYLSVSVNVATLCERQRERCGLVCVNFFLEICFRVSVFGFD